MLLAYTGEHAGALRRMVSDLNERSAGFMLLPEVSSSPSYLVSGIQDTALDWKASASDGNRKIIPFPDAPYVKMPAAASSCTVLSTRTVTVKRWQKPRTYRPVILPEPEPADDKSHAVVPAEAISALTRTIPEGRVATAGRIKGFLKFVYMYFYGYADVDTEKRWQGYARAKGHYLYSLQCHRVVDNRGTINGCGMSEGGGDILSCRLDAELLQVEGVVTHETDDLFYVKDLERYEYDFSDLFVGIETGKAN